MKKKTIYTYNFDNAIAKLRAINFALTQDDLNRRLSNINERRRLWTNENLKALISNEVLKISTTRDHRLTDLGRSLLGLIKLADGENPIRCNPQFKAGLDIITIDDRHKLILSKIFKIRNSKVLSSLASKIYLDSENLDSILLECQNNLDGAAKSKNRIDFEIEYNKARTYINAFSDAIFDSFLKKNLKRCANNL